MTTAPYSYEIQLPSDYRSDAKYPAVFLLHGIGSNERNMLPLLESVRDEFIVISVRGDLDYGNGYAYFTIKSIGNPHRDIFDRSVQQLERFVNYATERYAVDPARRYVAGFSQGAVLAMTLALTMGDRLKGIAALSGYIPAFVKEEYDHQPQDRVSVYISHGDRDHVFPLPLGRENEHFFKSKQSQVAFQAYNAGHEITAANQSGMLEWLRQDALNIN